MKSGREVPLSLWTKELEAQKFQLGRNRDLSYRTFFGVSPASVRTRQRKSVFRQLVSEYTCHTAVRYLWYMGVWETVYFQKRQVRGD